MSLLGMLVSAPAFASPLAVPGDLWLRHDIQMLSDAGYIRAPLTTWPLSLPDVSQGLMKVDPASVDEPALRETLVRVQARLRKEMRLGLADPEFSLAMNSDPTMLRGFQDTPREEGEVAYAVDYLGLRLAGRMEATLVSSAEDDKTLRLDGSYLSWALGNWTLSAGALDHWWGPGWDGSLIWSNNAHPIPGFTFERNYSTPFQTPWLSWIGPWKFTFFLGQLEGERAVPDARFFGMRFDFKPTDKLEIGLSRTAQWGGEERPEDFDTFLKLLAGIDNRGNDLAKADEPGNQLGGFDFRWRSPLFGNWPYAFYGQAIGEDEAGGLPSRYIGLFGIETWGSSTLLSGIWRVYLEAADTTAGGAYGDALPNYAYEHAIYKSGYRYYGHSIGHTADSDSRLVSLGLLLMQDDGHQWSLTGRRGTLNRDGTGIWHGVSPGGASDYFALELANAFAFHGGWLTWGLGYESVDGGDDSSDNLGLFAHWARAL